MTPIPSRTPSEPLIKFKMPSTNFVVYDSPVVFAIMSKFDSKSLIVVMEGVNGIMDFIFSFQLNKKLVLTSLLLLIVFSLAP